jgi:hypothetical protein
MNHTSRNQPRDGIVCRAYSDHRFLGIADRMRDCWRAQPATGEWAIDDSSRWLFSWSPDTMMITEGDLRLSRICM